MREILFRGKILYNGQWVEGHLVVCKTNGRSFITELIEVDEDSWLYWEVDPNTVGQYTGLTDKGRQSESQKAYQQAVEGIGARYEVVRTAEEFINVINDYLTK